MRRSIGGRARSTCKKNARHGQETGETLRDERRKLPVKAILIRTEDKSARFAVAPSSVQAPVRGVRALALRDRMMNAVLVADGNPLINTL